MGCTEGPPEDAELTAVTDAIAVYAGVTAKLKVSQQLRENGGRSALSDSHARSRLGRHNAGMNCP